MVKIRFLVTHTGPRLNSIAVVAIVALAVLLRLFFFQGYFKSDSSAYATLANDLAHGIVHLTERDYLGFDVRLGIYGPTAFAIKLFGLSEVTLSIYPFFASIANLLLVYALSRCLFDYLAGLISVSILAVLPTDIAMIYTLSRRYLCRLGECWDRAPNRWTPAGYYACCADCVGWIVLWGSMAVQRIGRVLGSIRDCLSRTYTAPTPFSK
jgi:hypothetical protein